MRILFIVDSMQRHLFFSRLARALKDENHIFFASSEPLSIILARLSGYPGKHLSKKYKSNGIFPTAEITETGKNCIEVLNGLFSLEDACRDLEAISEGLHSYALKHSIEKIIIWNGQQVIGRAAQLAANKAGIKAQYLEIANLPGKVFSDSEGVNALSSIARDIGIIDRLPNVPEELHQAWLETYESNKKKPLPQSQKKIKNLTLSALNIILKELFSSTCKIKISKRKNPILILPKSSQTNLTLAREQYIFLPLQVSSDTQIKLHSQYDNIAAIDEANIKANCKNLELIVKIHPAECDQKEITRIKEAQKTLKFKISNENTVNLIKNAHSVITINSTVGLEALLYNKPVTALGICLYKEFDSVRLKKYIHHYLVDGADYFNNTSISKAAAEKIIGLQPLSNSPRQAPPDRGIAGHAIEASQ